MNTYTELCRLDGQKAFDRRKETARALFCRWMNLMVRTAESLPAETRLKEMGEKDDSSKDRTENASYNRRCKSESSLSEEVGRKMFLGQSGETTNETAISCTESKRMERQRDPHPRLMRPEKKRNGKKRLKGRKGGRFRGKRRNRRKRFRAKGRKRRKKRKRRRPGRKGYRASVKSGRRDRQSDQRDRKAGQSGRRFGLKSRDGRRKEGQGSGAGQQELKNPFYLKF